MIEFKNVSLSYEEKRIIKNFNATFPDSGTVLITGRSGEGKTTLARLMLGLVKPDAGELNTEALKFAVVFQEDRLVPSLTALENVELVSSKEEARKRLCQMKLEDSFEKYPSELSGGMKRRVALARALAYDGDVLLLDEAFTGIDDPLAKELIGEICEEYKDKLIIAVTHRPELFSKINHKIISI